jgi:hypothetical protein
MSNLKNMLESMLYYYDELRYLIRNFKIGIKNLWDYKRIIYNDRQWDYNFIYDLLEFKLQYQLNWLLTSKNVYCQQDTNIIKLKRLLKLLSLIKQNYYSDELYKYLKTDFLLNDLNEIESNVIEDNLDEYFIKNRKVHNLYSDQILNRRLLAYKIVQHKEDRLRDIFFKMLSNDIGYLWD